MLDIKTHPFLVQLRNGEQQRFQFLADALRHPDGDIIFGPGYKMLIRKSPLFADESIDRYLELEQKVIQFLLLSGEK